MQNNWLRVSLCTNRKTKVRESELMLKCLHLSLLPSFTFTWNLNMKMSRKSRLTGNGNLSFAVCRKRESYCANPKTVNTRIIFGILLCCEEKANQMQDGKTARCNGN